MTQPYPAENAATDEQGGEAFEEQLDDTANLNSDEIFDDDEDF
ncbi:hypothetical protein [Catellatospora tritici]|nr:hypothetical protein [Catellatospora tritici]